MESPVEGTSSPETDTIVKFYTSFQKLDSAGMCSCYTDDVEFSDSVFVDLKGFRAHAMWKMLTERAKDLKVEFRSVSFNKETNTGKAHWEAWYTFGSTGNKVHNIIDAVFQFRDGKICKHKDTFDLYQWEKQALGITGLLLGWTGFMQNTVREKAMKGLEDYIKKNNLGPSSEK